GRKIVKEGEPSGGLYIILDGMVKVVRQHEGAERTLNLLREGELFGEISLIHNSAATATCIATRRTMVLFLSRREFEQVARDFPGVRERVNHLGEIRLLDSIYMLA
ncbi:MAG: cyclic nucleotide-binding domain-containing protein, partial [bacterium]